MIRVNNYILKKGVFLPVYLILLPVMLAGWIRSSKMASWTWVKVLLLGLFWDLWNLIHLDWMALLPTMKVITPLLFSNSLNKTKRCFWTASREGYGTVTNKILETTCPSSVTLCSLAWAIWTAAKSFLRLADWEATSSKIPATSVSSAVGSLYSLEISLHLSFGVLFWFPW